MDASTAAGELGSLALPGANSMEQFRSADTTQGCGAALAARLVNELSGQACQGYDGTGRLRSVYPPCAHDVSGYSVTKDL